MGKDPALLWYPNDWLGGTMGMTLEQKGAYMELLMAQFNRGHMTIHMIGQMVGQNWDNIKDKFIQDENGLWYNKRLEEEQNKRKAYVQSRSNNITGKNQYSKDRSYDHTHDRDMSVHMENENENEDENIDTIEKGNVNYFEISDLFNSICVSYPKVTKLSDSRKKTIKARLKDYGIDDFKKLFELAESNLFLKGENNKNWKANFDWLIKDSNMLKVLEGNYSNSQQERSAPLVKEYY